ncbi:hypothetical protein P7C71_g49, partial [Lecanoromycetidae sp. Uapishka_2]
MACNECASGFLHDGTPTGHVETLYGLPTYTTRPPNNEPSKGVVVIVPDAFGWNLNNSRILADAYAKRAAVTVYLPDFQNVRICQGSDDFVLNMDGVRQIEEIFAGKEKKLPEIEKGRFVISVVEGAKHGFAVRGNLGIEEEVKQGMVAEDEAVKWFQKWLDQSSGTD